MEFNQKLQELRKQKGLTQEELAEKLFVSRTAISKWESGRGYPSIESLKAIAKFFSVTVDELLSANEALTIGKRDGDRRATHFRDLSYGLLDICIALLFFLPFFAERNDGGIQSVSLISLCGVQPYLKITYLVIVALTTVIGILTLALQNLRTTAWLKSKAPISIALGAISVSLFAISSQPYAAVFAFALLTIKTSMLIKMR